VPLVGLLYHPQEAFLQFCHIALGLSHSGGDIKVLALDLRDGLFDEFDLVIFMGSFLGAEVPWIAHSGQMFTQHEKQ